MSYALSTTLHTTFEDAVKRTRKALADQGFGVLTEIDMKATLKAKLGEDDVASPHTETRSATTIAIEKTTVAPPIRRTSARGAGITIRPAMTGLSLIW